MFAVRSSLMPTRVIVGLVIEQMRWRLMPSLPPALQENKQVIVRELSGPDDPARSMYGFINPEAWDTPEVTEPVPAGDTPAGDTSVAGGA